MNFIKQIIEALVVLFFPLAVISGCGDEAQYQGPRYGTAPSEKKQRICHFAVHPLHNPARLVQAYQPLMDYLNKRIKDCSFILEASRDYAAFESKIYRGDLQFLLPNPWQTLEAIKSGYRVIAMAGEADDFKGIFIVRKDSPVKTPSDLKGKVVSYPAPTALAACIMPQYFLHSQGVNINSDIKNLYVGSQESSIMNVYLKKTTAGATWPPPWRAFQKEHPYEARQLKMLWETPPLINNSVMVFHNVPSGITDAVRGLLVKLHETDEGRMILRGMETARFFPASDSDYEVVRVYIERFEKEVRPVKRR